MTVIHTLNLELFHLYEVRPDGSSMDGFSTHTIPMDGA